MPGYLMGNHLLVGSALSSDNGTYINESSQGFYLRGSDNLGVCYNIKTAITNGLNATTYLIENYTDYNYFDDPLLTFDDSILYGCKV
jgi:hypothetical protein